MTESEMNEVIRMRKRGVAFTQIAKRLNLNLSTVKSFCYRNEILSKQGTNTNIKTKSCQCCGVEVQQEKGRKLKRFCSDVCRHTWWNENRKEKTTTSGKVKTCASCGKEFYSYKQRKFCSHPCYINHRFGGEGNG